MTCVRYGILDAGSRIRGLLQLLHRACPEAQCAAAFDSDPAATDASRRIDLTDDWDRIDVETHAPAAEAGV